MPVLVDAYNVLHVTGVLPPALAGPDVDRLASYIARSRWKRHRAVLVCDGKPAGEPTRRPAQGDARGRVEILYAGPGRDADALLERLIRESSASRRMVVVSSDRRIQAAARRSKARALASEDFLRGLVADLERSGPRKRRPDLIGRPATQVKPPLDPQTTEAWIEDLGLSGDPLLALTPSAVRPPSGGAVGGGAGAPLGDGGQRRRCRPSPAAGSTAGEAVDPLLLEALEEWSDRLSVDDFDMARWLHSDDTPPDG